MVPLRPAAQRQYTDAVAVFTALEEAAEEAAAVRGGMYWKNTGYLIRTSTAGAEKSLGPRSPDTEATFDRFTDRKAMAAQRLARLKASLADQVRLNRALRVGRVDPLVTRLLARLSASGLAEHFRVVGTHALYAYESEAGVRVDADAVATRDIDLLWDVASRLRFATALGRVDGSMLAVLRKVDPTFRVRRKQLYTAVNADGFEVDILRREAIAGDPHPIRLSDDEDDLWVVQAPNAHRLLDAPPFSAVVVAIDGSMARMDTLHPLAFARFKRWMAKLPERDPRKRQRDALQADAAATIVREFLPHLA